MPNKLRQITKSIAGEPFDSHSLFQASEDQIVGSDVEETQTEVSSLQAMLPFLSRLEAAT
jgi:hypothetical protein